MVMIRPKGKAGKLAEQVVPALQEQKSKMGDFKEMMPEMMEIMQTMGQDAFQVEQATGLPVR